MNEKTDVAQVGIKKTLEIVCDEAFINGNSFLSWILFFFCATMENVEMYTV